MAVHSAYRLVLGLVAGFAFAGAAQAGDYSNASSYNSGYGMNAGDENKAADFSLRDANGNMTILNGMFTSASNQMETGAQQASATSNGTGAGSPGGMSGAGTVMNGGAQAIGNSLNVVTYGSFNTVIVNSTQTNNGNQTASVVLNNGQ